MVSIPAGARVIVENQKEIGQVNNNEKIDRIEQEMKDYIEMYMLNYFV